MSTAYNVIGTRPPRHDGADKVTGRAIYGADVQMAGLLHGAIVRSPHAHARIKRVDTSKAAEYPGVMAVVTADDFPQTPDRLVDLGEGETPLSYVRGNVLAKEKALYEGHAIAGVAATSAHVAEQAARLIEIEYDVLPCVLNVTGGISNDEFAFRSCEVSVSNINRDSLLALCTQTVCKQCQVHTFFTALTARVFNRFKLIFEN